MTKEKTQNNKSKNIKMTSWLGLVIILFAALVIVLLGLLGVSIMERRWEAQRPSLALKPISQWEPDNAIWGQNYPREYETYSKTSITDTETKFGGSFPRDYLDIDPYKVIL
ncbi:MAG: ammonia-forming cytochrome c nitrite reductase subunit c552, partial [Planctomycetota bacterium]